MHRLAAILTAVVAIGFADRSALADKRVAFVVGNSKYQNVIPLANPANDAAAITELFKKAAFHVVESRYWLPIGDVNQWCWSQLADVGPVR